MTEIKSQSSSLLQMTVMTESGYLLWEAMANYLKNEILCSSDSKKRWESQPLRNKICHGDQLNFGTQEHSIKAILNGDAYLLSFDETNRWHQEEYWPLLFFPIVFAIVWGAYVAGSIIVGRNPKKFSKKVIKLFFKDGYVKY